MNFGIALALLKAGKRVARRGWNGKGMYVYLVPEGRYPPTTNAGRLVAARTPDRLVPYRAYLAMKTVDHEVVPWVISQTDALASDWTLADGERVDFDTIEAVVDEGSEELSIAGRDGDGIDVLVVTSFV